MNYINRDMVMSAVRWIMTMLGTSAVVAAHTDPTSWAAITGGAVALAAFVWSMVVHKDA